MSSNKHMEAYSLTIRNRNIKDISIERLSSWLKQFDQYVWNFEGDSHYQVAFTSANKRPDNLKRSLIKALNYVPVDDDEKRTWILLKKHHNFAIICGYCLKEEFKGGINLKEFSIKEVKDAYENYKAGSGDSSGNAGYLCTSINTLPWIALEYYKNMAYTEKYTLRGVVCEMVSKQLVPVSIYGKLRKCHEGIWMMIAFDKPLWTVNDWLRNCE